MLGLKGIGFYSSLTSSNCKKETLPNGNLYFWRPLPMKKTKLTVKKVRPKGQNKTHLFILKKNPDPEKER